MREGNRANILLVELLLVILFFMLSMTTIVELFGAARVKSRHALATNSAVLEAQNLAERLYVEDDAAAELSRSGFAEMGESWVLTEKDYTLEAVINEETQESGTLRVVTITGKMGDKELFSIPSSRYIPREVAQ